MEILLFFGGLALGLLFGWLLKPSPKIATSPSENPNLQAENQRLQQELIELHRAAGAQDQIIDNLHESLRKAQQKDRETYDLLQQQLQKLSEDVLRQGQRQSRQELQEVLSPFGQRLLELEQRIQGFYQDETRQRMALREQLKQLAETHGRLSQQAEDLSRALKGDTRSQGRWGEWVLERMLEAAGLQKETHFRLQHSQTNEEGRNLRPDCLLLLPEKRCLIVDSKVSLTAYERFVNAPNPEQAQTALREHVLSLKRHIQGLSSKRYERLDLNTPDFVLLFTPLESALSLALQAEPELLDLAAQNNIFLCSPLTLLPLARILAYLWTQEGLQRNALDLARQGGIVHDRLVKVLEQYDKLGDRLKQTERAHAQLREELSQKLAPQALILNQLGAKSGKNLSDNWLLDKENPNQNQLFEDGKSEG